MCKTDDATWTSRLKQSWRSRRGSGSSGSNSQSRWQKVESQISERNEGGKLTPVAEEAPTDRATSSAAAAVTTQDDKQRSGQEAPSGSAQKEERDRGRLTDDRLIEALAATYTSMCAMADESKGAQRISPFHAKQAPAITVHNYIKRLFTYFKCSEECLLSSLIYIDRIVKLHPGFKLSERCIHRVLATSMMLSAKFNDDVYYSNAYYSKVSGITLKEMNGLEVFFLKAINWSVHVTREEYEQYESSVFQASMGKQR